MNLRSLLARLRRRPAAVLVENTVQGERTIPSVNRERSMQSRMTTILAVGAVGLVVGTFLVWYYVTQFDKLRDAESAKAAALAKRASNETKVPPLGFIPPPKPAAKVEPVAATDANGWRGMMGSAPPPPAPSGPPASPQYGMAPPAPMAQAPTGPPQKTPAELERELKLKADVFQRGKSGAPVKAPGATNVPAVASASPLGDMLKATSTVAVTASVLPDRRFLLAKGTSIDCTLETAIDSTLPGMTRCVGAGKVFSADGSTVLLEEGTQFVGETKGEVKQGMSRVFVVWSEATTRNGVRVNLASPGTDALGRSGLEGWTDNHFWDRFGAAIMLTLLDSSIALLASNGGGNGNTTVALNPSGVSNVATEALKSTVAIPPTVRVNQGERIRIFVARDADFRSAYGLRTTGE
jgi:type IV secretion system protein VirB10